MVASSDSKDLRPFQYEAFAPFGPEFFRFCRLKHHPSVFPVHKVLGSVAADESPGRIVALCLIFTEPVPVRAFPEHASTVGLYRLPVCV